MTNAQPETGGVPPVERVKQEVDRWLEAVKSTGERALETLGLAPGNRPSLPAVDVIELPYEVVVQVDLPGIAAEGVELSIIGNMLTVSATRSLREFSGEARVHVRERIGGKVQRSIPLPAAVNDDGIRAETRDGLLTVTLKKVTPTASRSIPVTTGDAPSV